MALSKDDLLKLRYKVMADYPGQLWPIGTVITQDRRNVFSNTDHPLKLEPYPERYPAIFRKMEWWEEREEYFWLAPGEQRRPLFVSNIGKTVYGSAWGINLLDGSFTLEVSGNPTKANLTNYILATEEEYNQYTQKQTTNG